jgi:hypothetical protein
LTVAGVCLPPVSSFQERGASKQPESTDKKMAKSVWLNIDRTFGNFRRFSLSPKGWKVQIARKPVFIDRNRIFTSLSVDLGKQLAPHHQMRAVALFFQRPLFVTT